MQLSVAFKFYYYKLVLRWFDSAASEQKAAMILFQYGQFVGISPKNICFLSLDLKENTQHSVKNVRYANYGYRKIYVSFEWV